MLQETDKLVANLKNYFEKRNDIVMAFLFGSYAKGRGHKESDVDIAVYFRPRSGVEVESKSYYNHESEVWSDVEKITGREVDLLVLNRASSSVCDVAVRRGIPIIIKDRRIFLWYLLAVTDLAEEFRDYIFDIWRIKNAYRCRMGKITKCSGS